MVPKGLRDILVLSENFDESKIHFYEGDIRNTFFGKSIEIDRNVQAISGVFVLNTYSLIQIII